MSAGPSRQTPTSHLMIAEDSSNEVEVGEDVELLPYSSNGIRASSPVGLHPKCASSRLWPVLVLSSTIAVVLGYVTLLNPLCSRGWVSRTGRIVDGISKHVVIASYTRQDVAWTTRLEQDWGIRRYIVDEPNPSDGYPIPVNQRREAMAYLTYIVENYDKLPDYMVFIHGHLRAWHQPEAITSKIRALNLTSLDHQRYINLRCSEEPGCNIEYQLWTHKPIHANLKNIRAFYDSLFPNGDPLSDDGHLPDLIRVNCCAQFAVTRAAVQVRSLEDWTRIRDIISQDKSKHMWARGPPVVTDYDLGMFFEYTWHLLFGMPGVLCPSPEQCRQEFFSDAITCDNYTGEFPAKGWRETTCVDAFEEAEDITSMPNIPSAVATPAQGKAAHGPPQGGPS